MTTTTKTLLPSLSLKGLEVTETNHEKYGAQLTVRVNGKSGKSPRVTMVVDGKLMAVSFGSEDTGKLDSEGNAIWVPIMRLKAIEASVPKAAPKPETFSTASVAKDTTTARIDKMEATLDAILAKLTK